MLSQSPAQVLNADLHVCTSCTDNGFEIPIYPSPICFHTNPSSHMEHILLQDSAYSVVQARPYVWNPCGMGDQAALLGTHFEGASTTKWVNPPAPTLIALQDFPWYWLFIINYIFSPAHCAPLTQLCIQPPKKYIILIVFHTAGHAVAF